MCIIRRLFYRIGTKVGVLSFDVRINKDIIEYGVIVGAKWVPNYTNDKLAWTKAYAVRIGDHIRVCQHGEIWKAKELKETNK